MKHRVYYAITFDDATIHQIASFQNELIERSAELKAVPHNCFHMTLAFIGEVQEERLDLLRSIRREISFHPFTFQLTQTGSFPDRKNSRLYYLTSANDQPLYKLQQQLTDALKKHQIPFHDKEYLPHVTLARKTLLTAPLPMPSPITVSVNSFHLLESVPYQNTRIGIIIDD